MKFAYYITIRVTRDLSVSDSKNGARLEWWDKSLYNDLYH